VGEEEMSQTSHDLLARLSPLDSGILTGPGTFREKWSRLSPEGKDVLEQILVAAGNELQRVTEMAKKVGLLEELQSKR
jgi:hypothetical protein